MLMSPAFKKTVEAILKDLPPCTSRKLRRRQASGCGLQVAKDRIIEDDGVDSVYDESTYFNILSVILSNSTA
ncbi:hypothetical protein NXS19_006227 [Fusarium pseudograminearum]|nr:hypothetical protein NXS19_006227 [Fusarium pseudograminearum]